MMTTRSGRSDARVAGFGAVTRAVLGTGGSKCDGEQLAVHADTDAWH